MATVFNQQQGRPEAFTDNSFESFLTQKGFGGGFGKSFDSGDFLKKLVLGLTGGIGQEMDWLGQQQGNRLKSLEGAYDALDPRNRGSLVQNFITQGLGGAQRQGRSAANILERQFGQQPGLRAGAMIEAENQAMSRAGDFNAAVNDPANLASLFMQQAGVLSPQNVLQNTQFVQSLLDSIRQGGQKQKSPSFLDSVLGIGAGWASSGFA